MYHDIGRFIDKKDHPYASYLIITQKKLFKMFELSKIEKQLIIKVIQYHLLFATIYTGESTFYGTFSLPLFQSKTTINTNKLLQEAL